MALWERVFAAVYDRMLAGTEKAGLRDRRRELLTSARGRVLEIGAGTGANLDFYPDAVTQLVVTEPAEPMAVRLQRKSPGTQVVRAPAEELPFPDASFDTVVATLVLCTVHDLDATLREIGRVLKPDGQLLFLEHIRSDDEKLVRWQNRLNGLQNRIACGCNLNRPTPDVMRAHGFVLERVEHGEMPKAPPLVRPMAFGVARPPSATSRSAPSSTPAPA
jgi:SAM-dependent methyltransferase